MHCEYNSKFTWMLNRSLVMYESHRCWQKGCFIPQICQLYPSSQETQLHQNSIKICYENADNGGVFWDYYVAEEDE